MKKIKMCLAETHITFEKGCEEYIQNCKSRNLREGTIKHYRDTIKQIQKVILPDSPIDEMDIKTYENFVIEMREREGINDQSLYTYSRDLKTLMRFFMKQQYIPTFEIKCVAADKTPIETYTDEELKRLLRKPNLKKCNFAEYRTWVIVNFLLSTGVRQRSLLNIKIEDLDFDAEMIKVNVTKTRKPLVIPMNTDIKKILKEYLQYRGGNADDFLFCSTYGGVQLTKSGVVHALLDYTKSRNVEHSGTHRFRHTFAKKWVMMGGNVVTLQRILGHTSLQMTQNYINLLVSDIQKDVEEFNILRQLKQETIKMK